MDEPINKDMKLAFGRLKDCGISIVKRTDKERILGTIRIKKGEVVKSIPIEQVSSGSLDIVIDNLIELMTDKVIINE